MSEFWFEYVGELRAGAAWCGGSWQLLKDSGWIMPIKVTPVPKSPLNYFAFRERLPRPDELRGIILTKRDSGITTEGIEKLRGTLESMEQQFCTVPGDRLFLSEEVCRVLHDMGVGAEVREP